LFVYDVDDVRCFMLLVLVSDHKKTFSVIIDSRLSKNFVWGDVDMTLSRGLVQLSNAASSVDSGENLLHEKLLREVRVVNQRAYIHRRALGWHSSLSAFNEATFPFFSENLFMKKGFVKSALS
jgi:hypothetical protein